MGITRSRWISRRYLGVGMSDTATMIEKMARAMHPGIGWEKPEQSWMAGGRDAALEDAKRALQAMIEPTEAMIDRFVSRALCVSVHGEGGWSDYAREQWKTMIQAAIEEGV